MVNLMKVFFTELDVDCEVCEPVQIKPHWWSTKLKEIRIKAKVGVRVQNCDKTKRDYIYLCDECFTKFGYQEIEYIIDVISEQDEINRSYDL